MMIIEMREAAFDKALDKLEETKHHAKKTKLALCELEDAMYDCYEMIKEKEEDYEENEDLYSPEEDDEDYEIDFRRGSRNMRRSMKRMHRDDEDDYMNTRSMRRRSMRRRMR